MVFKVFYYLGVFEEFLNYVFGVGDFFNVNDNFEYVEIIIGNYFLFGKVLFCRFFFFLVYVVFVF